MEDEMIINKVEKGIDIPAVNSRQKYPWETMKVSDSVFFEAEKGESLDKLKRRVGPAATDA